MREISVINRHPRLRLDRRALGRALACLDARFRFTPADVPTLTKAAKKRIHAHPSLVTRDPLFVASPSVVPSGELSVTFLTDPALAKLHADYLDDPATTDVITFEGDESMDHAGDVCVSVDTAIAYATRHDLPFAEELLRYVVHGWLHLAGYDDLEPRKKRRMRAAENRALKLLHAADFLPAFTLRSPG